MSIDLEGWRARFGADRVLPYAPPAGQPAFLPGATPVVLPTTLEELQECLRFATAAGLRVLPAGAGENLHLAPGRDRIDAVLSLRRWTRLVEYEPADFTLIAQAGATLHDIAAALLPARQRLGPRPWPGVAATVGGACAANRNGPDRLGRGSWRDAVLGCRVVHVDGTSTKSGGRVVKNVSGYDLAKLYIGSRGTLAILTEINLRAVPAPETRAVVRAAVPFGRARELLLEAQRGALQPQAFVLTLGAAIAAADAVTLWACFEGRANAVEVQAAQCAAQWNGEVLGGAEAAASWEALERFDVPRPGTVHLELATLPVAVVDVVATIRAQGGEAMQARALFGVGTVHVRAPESSTARIQELLVQLAARGVAARWCTHPLATPPTLAPLHAALKRIFDPELRLPQLDALVEERGA